MASRNVLRLLVEALLDSGAAVNKLDLDGGTLKILPATDDNGAINVGDGTNDVDVKVFLGSTTEFVEFNVGDSKVVANCAVDITGNIGGAQTFSGTGRTKHKINAITANTTLNTTHLGGIVTTRGASGAVTVTLPAASGNSGEWVEIVNVADQNLIVTGTDEELVVFNDLTADSIAFQTTGEKIGGAFVCICDGTSWLVQPRATETQTITIVSA